jgi:hypothetical protein
MFVLSVDTKKVTNDRDLPSKPEKGLLFYEMVIAHQDCTHPIIRAPFHPSRGTPTLDIELWRHDITVPDKSVIDNNMSGLVARYKSLPLEIHFYKVMGDVDEDDGPVMDRLAYKRHIREDTSDIQDITSFKITKEGIPESHTPSYLTRFYFVNNQGQELVPLNEVKLTTKGWGATQLWLTQRNFYGTTSVTSSNSIHRENLECAINKFLKKYKNKTFRSIKDLLVEYGVVLKVGRIKYESDTVFAENGVPGDAGDTLIELSSKGDCEDFGHFYMRTIRMLTRIYKFVLDPTSDLYKKCHVLETEYLAYNYICRVLVMGSKEFHSTMLLIPRTATDNNSVISFEVTDPEKSYTLPDTEFDKWHLEHYFLLDSISIHRLNRTTTPLSPPLDKVNGENLFLYNY